MRSLLTNVWTLLMASILLAIFWIGLGPIVEEKIFGRKDTHIWWLASLCAWVVTIAGIWLNGLKFQERYPVASVLLGTTWRIMSIGGLATISAATKWPDHKIFCLCLLACYFSFLTLESAFSIYKTRLLSSRSRESNVESPPSHQR